MRVGLLFCVAGAAAFVWASPVSLGSLQSALEPGTSEPDLRVLSYNVNYGMSGDDATVELIADSGADLVLLQETTVVWQQAIESQTREAFPHQSWRAPSGGYLAGGSAILSRWPMRELKTSPSPVGWFEASSAVIDTPRGELRVVGVHLEPAVTLSAAMQVSGRHQDEMFAHADAFSLSTDIPTLVAGDFNEERAGALRTLEGLGFVDAIDAYAPGEPSFVWPIGPMNLELQLDHILYRGLDALNGEVLAGGGSDHQAVRAVFRFR